MNNLSDAGSSIDGYGDTVGNGTDNKFYATQQNVHNNTDYAAQ